MTVPTVCTKPTEASNPEDFAWSWMPFVTSPVVTFSDQANFFRMYSQTFVSIFTIGELVKQANFSSHFQVFISEII